MAPTKQTTQATPKMNGPGPAARDEVVDEDRDEDVGADADERAGFLDLLDRRVAAFLRAATRFTFFTRTGRLLKLELRRSCAC